MSKMLLRPEITKNLLDAEFDVSEGTYHNLGRKVLSIRQVEYDGETYIELDFPLWESKDQPTSLGHVNTMITPRGAWAGKQTLDKT